MSKENTRELLYEGSVKRVWKAAPARLWFEFTDDYSVFDWGKMPDTIANKGRALTVIGAYLFELLHHHEFWERLPESPHLNRFDKNWLQMRFQHKVFADLKLNGLQDHYRGLETPSGSIPLQQAGSTDQPVYMEVCAADVARPTLHRILHQQVYAYPTVIKTRAKAGRNIEATGKAETEAKSELDLRLIPLEIVFRFGMPTGSSLIDRLEKDPSYALELGIEKPVPGAFFAHPVVEFYTKLEPKDRLLSWQEAALMSQLDGTQLEHMVEVALDVALALFVVFAELGIELWDGKVEMVEELGKDTPLLADSIGPDELRLLYKGCHLSKEMIRQIYKDSEWKKKLKDAQDIAKTDSSARSWKEIAVDQLHAAPERLRSKEKAIVDQLYGVLANTLVGKTVFKDHPTLEQFVQELPPELRGAGAGANAGAGSATKTLLSGQSNRSQGG